MRARGQVLKQIVQGWMPTITGISRQLLSAAFVFAVLATAVYSIEKVVWVSPQPHLLWILLSAIIVTVLLINIKLPNAARHAFILLAGTAAFIWQISALVSPQPWWQALNVKPNHSTIYFSAVLISGAWLIGYVSAWAILKKRNAWITIFLGATVMLINLNNLPSQEYYQFFPVFVLASVLLLGYTHLEQQYNQMEKCSQAYSKKGSILYAGIVVVLALIISFSAKLLPDIKFDPEKSLTTKISWNVSREEWFNIFADVNEKVNAAVIQKEKNTEILFLDPPSEDKTLLFSVNQSTLQYLRLRRYDRYLSTGWSSNDTIDNTFNPQDGVLATDLLKRTEFTYTITRKAATDELLLAGEFKTASLPVLVQTMPAEPPLRSADIISVTATRDILPGETYTMTTWVSQASPTELYLAGTEYPDWVKQRYLQLPSTLPERVKALSLHLTEDAKTPYEKAIDIKKFLQRFTYNVVLNSPPTGVDAVDYFLFEKKAGDCTYFSSAMAVMLRSVGVPARISSGYRLLEKDPDTGQLIARSLDYHARTEVYFPGYGWTEFEVTPGLPGLTTEDNNVNLEEIEVSANVTNNATTNASQKVKINYVNYDEEGNLLDEFGNPIYQNEVYPGVLPPNMGTTSPNSTANVSINATTGPSHNTSANASANVSLNQSANLTRPATPNATRPAASNVTQNVSLNAAAGEPPGGNNIPTKPQAGSNTKIPPLLIKVGQISLAGFFIGLVFIFLYQLWLGRVKRTRDARMVYGRMCMLASLSKSGPKPFETPAEYGSRLGMVFQGQGQAIASITQIYAESRFGKAKDLQPDKRANLEQSWFQLYPVLIKQIFHLR